MIHVTIKYPRIINNISIFQAVFNMVHINNNVLQINGASQIEVTYFKFQQRRKNGCRLVKITDIQLTICGCVLIFLRILFGIIYTIWHAKVVRFE